MMSVNCTLRCPALPCAEGVADAVCVVDDPETGACCCSALELNSRMQVSQLHVFHTHCTTLPLRSTMVFDPSSANLKSANLTHIWVRNLAALAACIMHSAV